MLVLTTFRALMAHQGVINARVYKLRRIAHTYAKWPS